jgi:uridine phosphorylase
MSFYDLKMDPYETELGEDIRDSVGLSFTPYVVKGSGALKDQIGIDMITGNTVTCPGFYGPQGRFLRTPVKFPKLLDDLNAYHHKNSDFWLTNFEMETSGYYGLGRLMGHEILSVNAIIANRVKNRFSSDPDKIIDDLIKKVLDRI